MSELDAILKELAAQNNNDETAQITQPTQPLVNVNESHPFDASPVPVSTPKVPLHLSYSINAADVREVLNVNAPLPFDIGISRVYGCTFHSPPSASDNGPTVYPPPHPFLEVQRRRAFENLKSNFLSLLDQHLSTAKLKGKSNASSIGSGKAAFERWHFAVKLSESIQARESSYYRDRRRGSPASSSHATWVSLKDNVTSRVEAEVRQMPFTRGLATATQGSHHLGLSLGSSRYLCAEWRGVRRSTSSLLLVLRQLPLSRECRTPRLSTLTLLRSSPSLGCPIRPISSLIYAAPPIHPTLPSWIL